MGCYLRLGLLLSKADTKKITSPIELPSIEKVLPKEHELLLFQPALCIL